MIKGIFWLKEHNTNTKGWLREYFGKKYQKMQKCNFIKLFFSRSSKIILKYLTLFLSKFKSLSSHSTEIPPTLLIRKINKIFLENNVYYLSVKLNSTFELNLKLKLDLRFYFDVEVDRKFYLDLDSSCCVWPIILF